MTDTASLVRRWRQERGLSQTELAQLIGTGQAAISRIENGRDVPTLPLLTRIATALECRVSIAFESVEDTAVHSRE
ncbi:helix-turn-helix domain-containing protein [Streptomyces xanthii]|uniref:Helix-turn-helix transcriptional regulator n=1 Tax=Streptomyces xanthii TaxID=2768069 RepID=A0A7H1BBA4_9ACTN|nr:helix-turn-helix transcriptional regulator [Streptomyces xanthii]QNS06009.1 helix-turn-helix transcriptional regulator [Streptomyces xanthii]